MDSVLDTVSRHRDAILLAEIGALIHDLGKLSAEFIDYHAQGVDQRWDHELILRRRTRELYDLFPNVPDAQDLFWQWLENKFGDLTRLRRDYDRLCARRRRTLQESINDFMGKIHNVARPDRREIREAVKQHAREQAITTDFLPADLTDLLEMGTVLLGEDVYLADFVEQHGDPVDARSKAVRLFKPPGCDAVDSEVDKGNAIAAQPPGQCFIATAFGCESKIKVGDLKDTRYAYANALAAVLQAFQAAKVEGVPLEPQLWEQWLYGDNGLRAKTRDAFLQALGETRRSANDVTLWDHSYSVASLYKSTLAKVLIDSWQDPESIQWRILRVNVDALALYGKAHKVADLLAYQGQLKRALDTVKRLVEVQYPLGNEVYRDTSGIYFTFPDLELPAGLGRLIVDAVQQVEPELTPIVAVTADGKSRELKTLLADELQAARKDLRRPVNQDNLYRQWQSLWDNVPRGQFDVCPVCQIRPKRERDQECKYCRERRESRVKDWLRDPQSTIWMDEVADHNGRVALLVGRFDLTHWLDGRMIRTMLVNARSPEGKNPSPARVRRVWETTLRFWQETVGRILEGHNYGHGAERAQVRHRRWVIIPTGTIPTPGRVHDGTIDGRPISLFGEGAQFRTISNLQTCGVAEAKDLAGKKFESRDLSFVIESLEKIVHFGS